MLHWLHFYRARFNLALHRTDGAIVAYRDALAANPRFALAAAGIGFLEASRKQWAAAAQAFQLALDINPGEADFWFNLGYVREQQLDDSAAIQCFERATELNRSLDRAWFGMGLAYRRRHDNDAAARAFKVAAKLQPMNPHAFYELAMTQLALGNIEEIHRIIRQVAEFDPQMTRQLMRDTGQRPQEIKLQ